MTLEFGGIYKVDFNFRVLNCPPLYSGGEESEDSARPKTVGNTGLPGEQGSVDL